MESIGASAATMEATTIAIKGTRARGESQFGSYRLAFLNLRRRWHSPGPCPMAKRLDVFSASRRQGYGVGERIQQGRRRHRLFEGERRIHRRLHGGVDRCSRVATPRLRDLIEIKG